MFYTTLDIIKSICLLIYETVVGIKELCMFIFGGRKWRLYIRKVPPYCRRKCKYKFEMKRGENNEIHY